MTFIIITKCPRCGKEDTEHVAVTTSPPMYKCAACGCYARRHELYSAARAEGKQIKERITL